MTRDKDRHTWREGYTTGSCAAGAAKVACLLLRGDGLTEQVEIPLPNSSRLTMPIHGSESSYPEARASILKDGGDDADITHGLEVHAIARFISPQGEVHIHRGQGEIADR